MILNKDFILYICYLISNQQNHRKMAVKPEQIKARLKVKYPKANLSQKRLDAIAAKLALKPEDGADDEAIDAVLEAANDIVSFEEIARDDDRMRTLEKNQKTDTPTPAPTPSPAPAPAPTPEPGKDTPAWVQALLDSTNKLMQEVETMKTGKITENKRQTVSELIEKSEILKNLKPEVKKRWIDRVNLESDVPFEDQVKELETEYSDLVQTTADNSSYSGPAGNGSSDVKPDEAAINEIVDSFKI